MPGASAERVRAGRNTIGDAIERVAARGGDRVALRFRDRVWSFAALDGITTRMAAVLAGMGVRRGDRLVAFGRNSDHYLLVWIACCKAGVIHVPANYALSGAELGYIVTQCGASLLLHEEALADTAALAGVPASAIEAVLPAAELLPPGLHSADGARFEVDDLDVAQILYTSGTTGLPKGAMLTHRALLAEYASAIIACRFGEQDRALAALPLYHSAQMHAFCMPQLLIGAEILLIESPAPALCLELLERHRLTSFFAPPTVWINLLRHADFDKRDLRSLRNAYYGAAIMPVPVLGELRRRLPGLLVYNCYGQSEISPLATVLLPEEHDERPDSIGRPVCNVRTRVVDAQMNDVPPGERGEIVHRSPQLMLGYWGKPQETEEAFAGGWFHSGDIGVFDPQGYLFIVDRIKDVINTGGVLVASREVEDALFLHPAVAEVAVIAVPDAKWIEAIAAVVVLRDGETVSVEALAEHSRAHLAPFKVPKRIWFVDTLPKNTAGKLLKRELRVWYGTDAPP